MPAMLHDELVLLKSWTASRLPIIREATGGDSCPVAAEFERILNAWKSAAFSTASNEGLKRYYQHQQLELNEICSTFGDDTDSCLAGAALSLIDHLRLYYRAYFDTSFFAPAIYRSRFAAGISGKKSELVTRLKTAPIVPELKECLLAFLEEEASGCTYHYLDYFDNWVNKLSVIDLTENCLNDTLESLNFNDLTYYHYRQKILTYDAAPVSEKIGHLHTERSRLMTTAVKDGLACNPRWPSLTTMLCGWLTEEIAFLRDTEQSVLNAVTISRQDKYPLNLSVAHLACFLKLFAGAGLSGNRNMTQLFNFVSGHFSTKRQDSISAGSLSKEFYGTTQVTAAKVQGMLEQMIAEINRLYFP